MNLSNMPETAPDGYNSSYGALRDLLRFGPAILTMSEWAVLLFHAERSTVMGRHSDQHSNRDALKGIYRTELGRWVRGPSGVGKATWVKSNAALVARGFLKRYLRHDRHGRSDLTEYEIQWPAIAKAIEQWKAEKCEEMGLFNIPPVDERQTG